MEEFAISSKYCMCKGNLIKYQLMTIRIEQSVILLTILKKTHSCIYFFIYLREYIISLNIEKRERVEGFVSRY